MPYWRVPVVVIVEAADDQDAMRLAVGDDPHHDGRAMLSYANPPETLTPAEEARWVELDGALREAAVHRPGSLVKYSRRTERREERP